MLRVEQVPAAPPPAEWRAGSVRLLQLKRLRSLHCRMRGWAGGAQRRTRGPTARVLGARGARAAQALDRALLAARQGELDAGGVLWVVAPPAAAHAMALPS